MSRIFISYRRSDTSGYVIAIYDRLAKNYDPAHIFRDLDTIDYGDDFVERIEQAVQSCSVLLAVIGRNWMSATDNSGRRRLDNPHDFVRLEVATALQRGVRVIPVLVGGASMPYADEMPENLKPLARRNALEISDRDFHPHMDRLIHAIDRVLAKVKESPSAMTDTSDELKAVEIPKMRFLDIPSIEEQADTLPITVANKYFLPKPDLPDVPAILPAPFEWCEIPAGKATLEDVSDTGGTQGGIYDVPAFAIARYPLTCAQYQVFMDAKDGYRNSKWWQYSEHAKQWHTANNQLNALAYTDSSLPRTNLSWYDALAFCNWLSARVNRQITLPTEQQWQRAAQGNDRRKYPWGPTFDKLACNVIESGIRKPTSITKYPAGASPYGVVDMSGNVREWCLTEWGNDSGAADSNKPRVVRGGSFYDLAYRAACSFRYKEDPGTQLPYCGMRLVCLDALALTPTLIYNSTPG